jgi:hemerythrin-like domain-containing protein
VLVANRLMDRVRNHIQKEDGILFPILEVLLPSQLDEKVSNEFEKFHLDPGLLDNLRRLEWKYLRKTVS